MHPLQNGSQVTDRPPRKERVGTAGYFSESNDSGAPSYPGQDWFNDVIDEFKSTLSEAGIEYDPTKLNNLATAIKAIIKANGAQFGIYDPERIYKTGEVCYTITNDEVSFWQWYSNVESLAGKDPLNTVNRHEAWNDNTKPFYWIPYTGEQVGMPFFWLDSAPPEWAVMEINVDLPTAVYWRLARRYPHLVSGDVINTGEIRGEFLRVLDQGRGVDAGRLIGTAQLDQMQRLTGSIDVYRARRSSQGGVFSGSVNGNKDQGQQQGSNGDSPLIKFDSADSPGARVSSTTDGETRSRNIARPMAIAI